MDQLENCRQYLHSQVGSEECYPFGPDTQVFKIMGKMFALIGFRNSKYFINLKAKPDDVLFLIEQYDEIHSGYHMNKKHWISVEITQLESMGMLQGLIDDSYMLIKSSLPKKVQAELK